MTAYFWEAISPAEKKFIEFLDTGPLLKGKRGDYPLKSGRPSCYFIQMGETSNSEDLPVIGEAYAEKAVQNLSPGDFKCIFGPADKGIPLAVATGMNLPKEYGKVLVLWDRKVPKVHGETKRPSWVAGAYGSLIDIVKSGSKIPYLITEDVVTTGGTLRSTMDLFQKEIDMIREEIGKQENVETDCKGIIISGNRRETDPQGRNPTKVLEDELGTHVYWATDSYNIFGYLYSIEHATKEHVSEFVSYISEFGLPEDKDRLEQLKKVLT